MKSIFKLKYKLHYIVNCLFYIFIFIIGVLVGGGFFVTFEKIIDHINIFN